MTDHKKAKHLSAKDLNKVLPEATAAEFEIVNMEKRSSTRIVHAKYGTIDFKELSIARAKDLVKREAPFIKKRSKSK